MSDDTNVVILGATGRTGAYIVRRLAQEKGVRLTVFARSKEKAAALGARGAQIAVGDAISAGDVLRALAGQHIAIASLEGDVLTMAKNLVEAVEATGVRRVVWITGVGIHGEIRGPRGLMLNALAKSRPDYVKAADTIASLGKRATLLRCPLIRDGEDTKFELTQEGERMRSSAIDRAGIAEFVARVVADESLGAGQSLGICN